jgi:steroid delta-isomerase-like uncharacterized protein
MIEDLKATARRTWEQILPSCDIEALASVIGADSIDHGAGPDEPQGFERAKRAMFFLANAFSDQRWEIHQVIGEGDTVVLHCTYHGRQTGDLMGMPPTGREVAVPYVHIVRFRDGKIDEHWSVRDDAAMLRQLGVLPDRSGASAPMSGAAAPA